MTARPAAIPLALSALVAASCTAVLGDGQYYVVQDAGTVAQSDAHGPGEGAAADSSVGDSTATSDVAGDERPAGDGPAADGSCPLGCSTDLHDVVDCTGKVVTTCPPSEGCSGSSCVPACASAIANESSYGCDYYAVDPDIFSGFAGACFALFVANTWNSPVNISAYWGTTTLDIATAAQVPSGSGTSITYTPLGAGGLAPGQVAIVFLDDWAPGHTGTAGVDCPAGVTAAVTQSDGAVHGTSAAGKAFHIQTDRPVVAYDIFPYGGGQSAATSATLLVPTSAWDVNYIAVNAYAKDVLVPTAQQFLEIVASRPNTTVTINPVAAIVGATGVAPTPQGTAGQYTLSNPGDYLQITQDAELTGSPILADQPIGVWGGSTLLNIDVNTCCGDSAHQELLPVKTLGSEYVAVRYPDRFSGLVETTPWRFVGAVSGTALTYEPAAPAGAPTSLQAGQVATVSTSDPFVVRSQDNQHPFYISGHMTGANTVNPGQTDGRGDPEFVNVIPPADFLPSYVFFTDPTYPETRLVFVRVKGPQGFEDVTLDCAGTITGWLPVGSSGTYEYAQVTLSTGNFAGQNGCNNGRREASSARPFGLTVWGWGSAATGTAGAGGYSQYVSYAYPAGARVAATNSVVVMP